MNISLVYPKIDDYTSFWFPHLGLGYLYSALAKRKHNVEIIDLVAQKEGYRVLADKLKSFDLLGVTATTSEIFSANNICSMAKKINPRLITIVGGAHTTALPKETLLQFPDIDIAVKSEGENSLPDIVDRIGLGRSLHGIKGIAFRDGDKIVLNEELNLVEDLDSLDFPFWKAFDLRRYKGSLESRHALELPIITGRGCPFNCVFCQRLSGQRVRYRSVGSVIEEIKYDISLGAKSLYFCDETLTLDKKRTITICEEILRQGLNKKIIWNCETRVDVVDEKTLVMMRKAGCTTVAFGVESGNDHVLNASKKGFKVEDIKKAFLMAKKAGLKTYMFLIFGLPEETRDTIMDTIRLTFEINPDYITIGILVPFPGTEVYNMARQGRGGLVINNYDWRKYGKQMGQAIELKHLSQDELRKLQSFAYRKFYLRASRIKNIFGLASFKGLFSWVFKR